MNSRKILAFAFPAALALLAVATFVLRNEWMPWFQSANPAEQSAKDHEDHHEAKERVKLSPQAQANLRLIVKPVQLQSYRQTIQVPGVVVERRGKGDQSIVAPVTGTIKAIHALAGDVVEPGAAFATLRLNSESLQTSQTELYKTTQEVKITKEQKERLDVLAKGGAIPESRILELQYQLDRLAATRRAYRADLAVKGLLPQQIDAVEKGDFLKEFVVRVPLEVEALPTPTSTENPGQPTSQKPLLEMEEVKIFPGEQVQAGQLLAYVSNHQNLYVEGRGFREDTTLVEKAAASGWPLSTKFLEERDGVWPPLRDPLQILYLGNNLDPMSQTFPFYVPLPNQYREYTQKGKTYRIWRYRPGQRVQLGVPIQEFSDIFLLPQQAVVREGADVFVFRQNGEYFDRKPVHVLHEDSTQVVIANDGNIFPGNFIALTGAEGINRALKAQMEKSEGGSHGHHGHSH